MVWLLQALGLRGAEREEEVCTIYIGDDVTDEDAFHALVRLVRGFGTWCVGWYWCDRLRGWDRSELIAPHDRTHRNERRNRWRRRRAARGGWRGSGSW